MTYNKYDLARFHLKFVSGAGDVELRTSAEDHACFLDKRYILLAPSAGSVVQAMPAERKLRILSGHMKKEKCVCFNREVQTR